MKIVGIATRARITDYSLPYVVRTNSLVDTMALFLSFSLTILDMFTFFTSCMYSVYDVHTYRYQIGEM